MEMERRLRSLIQTWLLPQQTRIVYKMRKRSQILAAADFCIPKKEMENFIARVSPLFSRKRVLAFAQRRGAIHPGLVVGTLQNHLHRYDLFRQMLAP